MFSTFIASLKIQPDLIFVSEIWIYSYEITEFTLPNYNFKACCNDNYRAGGVGVFIHQSLTIGACCAYNWISDDVISLDIQLDEQLWKFLGFYRFCNNDINIFCNDLDNLLTTTNNSNIVILGDLNIDLLNSENSFNYQTMLASYGFLSLYNIPTRKLSCLDHVFVKSSNKYKFTIDNLPIHFSDHNLVTLNIWEASYRPVKSTAENIVKINYDQLRDRLLVENWDFVYGAKDCNMAFNNFLETLNSHIDFSKETFTFYHNKKLKPWMNSFLLQQISKLKKFSKKLRKYPNNNRLENYVKKLSKDVNKKVKRVKSSYYKNKFKIVGNNSKLMWREIDSILGRSSDTNQITQIYKNQSDVVLTDSHNICNEFNNFFINVSSDSNSYIVQSNADKNEEYKQFIFGIRDNGYTSCYFEEISSLEIMSEIKKLKNKHSKGFDGIDNVIVKNCSWYLVDILKFLFNFSLKSGIFPDALKVAVVIPVFKKGDAMKMNNYRPISLLSTFSKLLEKLIKQRLVSYLYKINFFNERQFGFLAGKSTEQALLNFLSSIYVAINNSQKCSAVFMDISKAFDTVSHDILITKLSRVGIRGHVYDWFISYLRNRSQIVRVNNTNSSPGYLKCGVPQGSVLGPLLFLIYFNSVFEINLSGCATAFADDLALTYTSNDYLDIQQRIASDLFILSKWFFYHRLVVSEKSRVMHFKRPDISDDQMSIKYHVYSCDKKPCLEQCFDLVCVSEFKYLGVTIDAQLNWTSHLNNIRKYIIIAVYKFYNLRPLCPSYVLRRLYHALIESILMYGITSWGGIYFSNIANLFVAQKRIVKIIYARPKNTRTVSLFREVNLLPLRYLYVFKVLKMFFVRSNSYHSRIYHVYNMRNPNNFASLRCNNEKFRRFYLYMAPYWFHRLPKNVKILPPEQKHKFNRETRTWLLSINDIEQYF